jgi:hypothetical protein
MSSAVATFVYGCPLGNEHDDYRPKDTGLDIHVEYGSSSYSYWWGETYGRVSNGFGDIPECSDDVKVSVIAEWNSLDQKLREHLGKPQEFVCVETS